MAVYVDDSMIAWRGKRWCHLTADSLEELHQFAEQLGLKREWFQERPQTWMSHYDVTAPVRVRAIELGAVDETWQQAAKRAIDAARAQMMGESRPLPAAQVRTCRECGCTAYDACWHDAYGACSWADDDICAACVPGADPEWEHPLDLEERHGE